MTQAKKILLLGMIALHATVWHHSAHAQLPTGILKSRWAMSDPEYAEKYARGAEKTDIPGKIKQASDARFVKRKWGGYLSGGLTSIGETSSPLGSLELGLTGYQHSWLTNRIGLVLAANDDDHYFGAEVGMRFQTPTRLAPFVGAGGFLGYSETSELAEDDGIDNDDNGFIDERGEEKDVFTGGMAAIYPEAGLHFWWTPQVRVTGFGRYLITTHGRAADSWYIGGSIAILNR